jgi:hypothetical protein
MRFDDLLGDRKAEPRILAEALVRPVGVEALEDAVDILGLMPGPLSSMRTIRRPLRPFESRTTIRPP